MTGTNSKRWEVLRRVSGKRLRAFQTRASARSFKRNMPGNLTIYDTVNQEYVR